MIGGDKSEDSIARMVIGRKMDNMVEIVKNTDSTNCGTATHYPANP